MDEDVYLELPEVPLCITHASMLFLVRLHMHYSHNQFAFLLWDRTPSNIQCTLYYKLPTTVLYAINYLPFA